MSAEGIFTNLAVCVPLGIFMFLLFVLLRRQLPLFYHRNILCHGGSVFGVKADSGFGEWVSGLIGMRDGECLRLAGLDALVLLNTIRLILIVFCIMAVPCLLLLIPYYYVNSDTSNGATFSTFTIADLYTEAFWPPLLVLTFLTVLILYGIYSFYANYIRMRQAFLLRPSSLTSIGSILNTAESFGSLKYARRRLDCSTCTVLLHPIPSHIPPQNLHKTLETSGVKGIKTVQFIGEKGYKKINEIVKKRNSSLTKLEIALQSVSKKLHKSSKEEFNSSKSQKEQHQQQISVKERSELIDKLITEPNFCSSLRPRHKTSKPAQKDPETPREKDGTVDSIRHYHQKLTEREEQLQDALKEFNTLPQTETETEAEAGTENQESETRDTRDGQADVNFEKRFVDETSFISWKKIKNVSENLAGMDAVDCTQVALLHFNDYRDACRAQQLLLTSRPNSLEVKMAPSPDDIQWNFITWSHRQHWYGAFKSNLFYWIFLITFAPIVAAVVAFVDMESLGKWIPAIETFRNNHPQIRTVLESVLAPFLAILLMKRTGIWVKGICSLRGPISKTELLLKTQSAHLFFLFVQVIFIGALFSNLYDFTIGTILHNYQLGAFLTHLRDNLPGKAHFFFNFMIQDIFTELMLELLNPKSLFFDRSFLSQKGRKAKTVRSLFDHDTVPPELEPTVAWSRYVMFPFFIIMIYIIIAPLIIIPAIAYFAVGYFVYKFRYAHYGRVSVEAGGAYWRQASQQMIYALILCQLTLLLQFTQFRQGLLPSIILIGLLLFTLAAIPFFKFHFGRILDLISILEDEVQGSKTTVQALLLEQNKLVPRAVEYFENSKLVKSKLESDLSDHFHFTDIDPLIENNNDNNKGYSNTEIDDDNKDSDVTSHALFEPYWSVIPLRFSQEHEQEKALASFDPMQVDSFVDLQYIKQQYEHPLILKHSQILMVPRDLPFLLKTEAEKQPK